MNWFWQTLITAHGILLGLFLCSTALLFTLTCLNRCRIRAVLFSWGRGRLFGLPLMPTLFLAAVASVVVYTASVGSIGKILTPITISGYLLGGLFWYVSAVLGETVIVTDYGLVFDVRRLATSIQWTHVVDYAEIPNRGSGRYALFYEDTSARRRRVDVRVPAALRGRFRVLVREKLDARFDYLIDAPHGTRELQP